MLKTPTEIRKLETGIFMLWSDGTTTSISTEILRRNCPCASCREQRGDGESHAKPLTGKKRSLKIIESSLADELVLERIWSVGNYALGMSWADGHTTGIYPFGLLEELGVVM